MKRKTCCKVTDIKTAPATAAYRNGLDSMACQVPDCRRMRWDERGLCETHLSGPHAVCKCGHAKGFHMPGGGECYTDHCACARFQGVPSPGLRDIARTAEGEAKP